MKAQTRKCGCVLCTKWVPHHKRIRKKLSGRDLKLYNEFVMMEMCQSDDLGMAEMQLEKACLRSKQYREVLEQIAAMPRKTREQRLASSCLHFVDALEAEKKPKESKL